MSKSRMVKTKFWEDGYTLELDPIEKLLFLYLLSNPLTNVCGVYEIPSRRIAFDTGIDRDMVLKIIERFSRDEKIFYANGWIIVVNFIKHQTYNENMKIGAKKALEYLPEEIQLKIAKNETLTKAFESIGYAYRKLELKPELELEVVKNNKGDKSPVLKDITIQINYLIEQLLLLNNINSLDGTQKRNRQLASNLIKSKIIPDINPQYKTNKVIPTTDQIKKAIDIFLSKVNQNDFHKRNATSINYLYNNYQRVFKN